MTKQELDDLITSVRDDEREKIFTWLKGLSERLKDIVASSTSPTAVYAASLTVKFIQKAIEEYPNDGR